jgi:MFS family permease
MADLVARGGWKILEGYVVFMTGVAMPLFSREFEMRAFEHGMIGAASLFGILVGAVTLGGLSDRFGRKPMFVAEMIIFCAFLVALCFATNYIQVVIFLFGLGLALGCDYPTAHVSSRKTSRARSAASSCWAHSPSRPSARWRARRSVFSFFQSFPNSAPGAGCSPARSFQPSS